MIEEDAIIGLNKLSKNVQALTDCLVRKDYTSEEEMLEGVYDELRGFLIGVSSLLCDLDDITIPDKYSTRKIQQTIEGYLNCMDTRRIK